MCLTSDGAERAAQAANTSRHGLAAVAILWSLRRGGNLPRTFWIGFTSANRASILAASSSVPALTPACRRTTGPRTHSQEAMDCRDPSWLSSLHAISGRGRLSIAACEYCRPATQLALADAKVSPSTSVTPPSASSQESPNNPSPRPGSKL